MTASLTIICLLSLFYPAICCPASSEMFHFFPSQAFGALQNKVATHQRKVNSLPATMPAIDFDSYRAKVWIFDMNFLFKYMFNL